MDVQIEPKEVILERMRKAKRYYVAMYEFWIKVNFSDASQIVEYLDYQVKLDNGNGHSKSDLYIHNWKQD